MVYIERKYTDGDNFLHIKNEPTLETINMMVHNKQEIQIINCPMLKDIKIKNTSWYRMIVVGCPKVTQTFKNYRDALKYIPDEIVRNILSYLLQHEIINIAANRTYDNRLTEYLRSKTQYPLNLFPGLQEIAKIKHHILLIESNAEKWHNLRNVRIIEDKNDKYFTKKNDENATSFMQYRKLYINPELSLYTQHKHAQPCYIINGNDEFDAFDFKKANNSFLKIEHVDDRDFKNVKCELLRFRSCRNIRIKNCRVHSHGVTFLDCSGCDIDPGQLWIILLRDITSWKIEEMNRIPYCEDLFLYGWVQAKNIYGTANITNTNNGIAPETYSHNYIEYVNCLEINNKDMKFAKCNYLKCSVEDFRNIYKYRNSVDGLHSVRDLYLCSRKHRTEGIDIWDMSSMTKCRIDFKDYYDSIICNAPKLNHLSIYVSGALGRTKEFCAHNVDAAYLYIEDCPNLDHIYIERKSSGVKKLYIKIENSKIPTVHVSSGIETQIHTETGILTVPEHIQQTPHENGIFE